MVIKKTKGYYVLGLMSGTSLDGLDMAYSSFYSLRGHWKYEIKKVTTVSYSKMIRRSLSEAHTLRSEDLINLDHTYGKWIAEQCKNFLDDVSYPPDIISSHGHTVFHQPGKGFSLQIGNGHEIAALTQIPVVFDFRSFDISLGGTGAPLVPAGDELLFPEYTSCLNLGGFSNISFHNGHERIAFDICPLNIAFNYMAGKLGYDYDKDGHTGSHGHIIEELLIRLNSLDYYALSAPRSLMREWFEMKFLPCLADYNNERDIMRTLYEHAAFQISCVLNQWEKGETLVTGGGARNKFFISLLRRKCKQELILPGDILIDYKEALIFGLLGLLRYLNKINCYRSATGAKRDSSTGVLISP